MRRSCCRPFAWVPALLLVAIGAPVTGENSFGDVEGRPRMLVRLRTQVSSSSYKYKDDWESGIALLVSSVESRLGENTETDEAFWRFLDPIVRSKASGRFLDAGCGMGRLELRYVRNFTKIVAADPDSSRLGITREAVSKVASDAKVEYVCCPAQNIPMSSGPFDLIVSNHVVQHTPTTVVLPILRRLQSLLAPDGVLVLATTNVPKGTEGFEYMGSTRGTGIITEAAFNKLTGSNESDSLGVRRYSKEQLDRITGEAGLVRSSALSSNWLGYMYFKQSATAPLPLLKWKEFGIEEAAAREAPISQAMVLVKRTR
jgi:2-polyprenyl-3-methyl-5-hydroxy-6-metoxy-1,4-benzoquinol methylase